MPKIVKKQENFLGLYVFSFNSYEAEVKIDTIHESKTYTTNIFHIESLKDRPIKYGYQQGKGLVKFNPTNGSIEESNVLGELLSIADGDTKKLKSFISKYGSLFPIETHSYTKYNQADVFKVIKKLRNTIELMIQVCEPRQRDYKKLFKLIWELYNFSDLEIKTHNNRSYAYCRKNHIKDEFESFQTSGMAYQVFDQEEAQVDEEFKETGTFKVSDIVYGEQEYTFKEYEELMTGKRWTPFFHNLSYFHFDDRNNKYIHLWDLFFHFFRENPEQALHLKYNNFEEFDKPEFKIKKEYKDALLKIGKSMLSTEINEHLKTVRPLYNSDKLEPGWFVKDLITAFYLSIFYLKPNVELIRKCGNPNCDSYFVINTSSSRTKYCCHECANAVAQANYRKRKRAESLNK